MNIDRFRTAGIAGKIAISITAVIVASALFGLLLFSTIKLGDILNPFFGDFAYPVAMIATIAVVNFICCKIIKPVCEVKFGDKSREGK
jgi:hypothetical protein